MKRPRGPGVVHAALVLVLLVLLGAFALTARQPPPPTIAEFAPQAVENITDAPNDQSSSSGRAGGAGAEGGGETPTPEPDAAPPIDVPRVRRCVGDPPRQIEDPQSPPCVPYWAGDNGGATYQGVTASEILLAAPNLGDHHLRMQDFFNARFEFYGRKINLINTKDDNKGADPEQQVAAAVTADESHKVFGSIENTNGGGWFYYQEMARRRLVVTADRPNMPEPFLRENRPYLWSYPMAVDGILTNVGQWTCGRLAGGQSVHAGQPVPGARPRTFGIIFNTEEDHPIDIDPIRRSLAACGIQPDPVIHLVDGGENEANAVLQMRSANVTSIFCLCHVINFGTILKAASGQGYFPEWLISSYLLLDTNFLLKTFAGVPEQLEHAFGITVFPHQQQASQTPAIWAQREADPGHTPANASLEVTDQNVEYRSLLLLASGIQMAGPRLTPETFERGLQNARFPNPFHPIMAGGVGFEGQTHSMTKDAAEYWWSNTAKGPFSDDSGTICYVDGGKRHRTGQWPAGGDPFFVGPCDSGA